MKDQIKIGIIGDYDEAKPSHKATNEALQHCAVHLDINTAIQWLPTETLVGELDHRLHGFDAFLCSPGSPYRSYLGALNAIRYARIHNVPFLGTCGGFQHAAMEYAQNVLHIEEVHHQEYNPDASEFFIKALSCSLVGQTRNIYVTADTLLYSIYGKTEITERYNCSFGLNANFQAQLDNSGFRIAGMDENREARVFELSRNDFYLATLYQPQLSSTPEQPHPLLLHFLNTARKYNLNHR